MDVLLWSRLQFAMTAAYHWLFVPLTLGLALTIAVMETLYVVKKDDYWKKTTQFWMKLFAINFAVGIATGIILEFEFGTNWSNYSWFVGDIFGAPLAIEGILAFFMEATFFAVMFFGWEKVSKRFHLISTWLTGIGASISAYWILVANSWMQHPVGTTFNPDTVRSEMASVDAFWEVITNPVAVSKFIHSVSSGWVTGGVFVVGVSCYYLMRKRNVEFARKSAFVGAAVAMAGTMAVMLSGDISGVHAAEYQPMKLAAAEGLEDGGRRAPFSIIPGVEIPGMLSILATHDIDGYVPGINDIINGYTDNEGNVIPSVEEKMEKGRTALAALEEYRTLKDTDPDAAALARATLEENVQYMGYGYLESPEDVIPPVDMVYWSFRVMVGGGMFIALVLLLVLWFGYKNRIGEIKWLHYLAFLSVPLVYLTGQAGWIVAEVGRQPWTIQGLLPVNVATSSVSAAAVQTTFFLFLAIFALFLIIEIRIMINAIKKGPEVE
ncbi:MAG: cytochrome ubiquinol oxidase subunit I [Flavobacteriales bacterium]|nr:cytochrome ubiquinol oxidase subunit I [Flavobacteriales bacterium]MBQ2422233.1 cytochrome ubiquinol oxidase subunit I [Flavobacteriales bacterium]